MCDYSLGGLPNRLAVEGEELVVHRFRTGSMGLASKGDLCPVRPVEVSPPGLWRRMMSLFAERPRLAACPPAVCVPPGARLILKKIPEDLRNRWCTGEDEEVQFMQCSADVNRYRDSIRFKNGRYVLLQELRAGMPVQVVSLGGDEAAEERRLEIAGVAL